MKGRKQTPRRLKIVRGNPGRRPIDQKTAEDDLPPGIPDPPIFTRGAALRYWKEITAELSGSALMAKVDKHTLAAYCSAVAALEKADRYLLRHKWVFEVDGVRRKDPMVNIAKEAREQIKSLAAELGLSITSRSRVRSHGKEKTKANPLEELQRRRESAQLKLFRGVSRLRGGSDSGENQGGPIGPPSV